jgi:hypothetical protein
MRSGPRITAALVAATLACNGLRASAADAPAPPPAATTAPAAKKPGIELLANEPGLTYWLFDAGGRRDPRSASPGQPGTGIYISSFRMLCIAPCSTQLAPGTYTMGISRPGNALVTADPLTLRGDELLKATYKSRWALRLGFFLGGLLTAAIGGAVAFSGDESGGRQALGAGILATGVLGMVTPLFIQDKAMITVLPR